MSLSAQEEHPYTPQLNQRSRSREPRTVRICFCVIFFPPLCLPPHSPSSPIQIFRYSPTLPSSLALPLNVAVLCMLASSQHQHQLIHTPTPTSTSHVYTHTNRMSRCMSSPSAIRSAFRSRGKRFESGFSRRRCSTCNLVSGLDELANL